MNSGQTFISFMPFILLIVQSAVLLSLSALAIYTMILAIKALKIYIKNNSQ